MRMKRAVTWVIYRAFVRGKLVMLNAVCEQTEWDEMESHNPGQHSLIQSGFVNEADAEKLARTLEVRARS